MYIHILEGLEIIQCKWKGGVGVGVFDKEGLILIFMLKGYHYFDKEIFCYHDFWFYKQECFLDFVWGWSFEMYLDQKWK